MELILIRHAQTAFNAEGRYAGSTDIPLNDQGEKSARQSGSFVDEPNVFVSPLVRARQTASILFPNAAQTPVEGLREMDFGAFEGRTAAELEGNPDYRAWLESGGEAQCPGGDDMAEFTNRAAAAFAEVVRQARANAQERGVVVTHGGVIMALMGRFARPKKDPYSYFAKNCEGYRVWIDEDSFDLDGEFLSFEKIELQKLQTGLA